MLHSTASLDAPVSWREGVLRGLAPDGGLYLPVRLPALTPEDLSRLAGLPFSQIAAVLATRLIGAEVPPGILAEICHDAFCFPVPLREIGKGRFVLELFHGPTCAFKDFGARFMARLFRHFWGAQDQQLTVLVATSGDTGSAVAHAFLDSSSRPPIRVAILFPRGKVSPLQERQMTTLGANVTAFEVDGSFDDCQRLVKQALSDRKLHEAAPLTSANSINIARLLPQMFYYVHMALSAGLAQPPIVSVPSGNLGNLTGGVLAHLLGVPFCRLIAASNSNSVFPEYLTSGAFVPKPSQETISNAMDVGNPSNFLRLAALFGSDLSRIRSVVEGDSVSEGETLETMRRVYQESGYVLDPHTAVGACALERVISRGSLPRGAPSVVLGTAHPAKFSPVVQRAIGIAPELPPELAHALAAPPCKEPLPNSYAALRSRLAGG